MSCKGEGLGHKNGRLKGSKLQSRKSSRTYPTKDPREEGKHWPIADIGGRGVGKITTFT